MGCWDCFGLKACIELFTKLKLVAFHLAFEKKKYDKKKERLRRRNIQVGPYGKQEGIYKLLGVVVVGLIHNHYLIIERSNAIDG